MKIKRHNDRSLSQTHFTGITFFNEYAYAATSDSNIAHSKSIDPGLIIKSTAIIPTTRADQRLLPTFSFKISEGNAVISNGDTKRIADAFAN